MIPFYFSYDETIEFPWAKTTDATQFSYQTCCVCACSLRGQTGCTHPRSVSISVGTTSHGRSFVPVITQRKTQLIPPYYVTVVMIRSCDDVKETMATDGQNLHSTAKMSTKNPPPPPSVRNIGNRIQDCMFSKELVMAQLIAQVGTWY